jgi:hypothetical protein
VKVAPNTRVQRARSPCFASSRSPLTRHPLGGLAKLVGLLILTSLACQRAEPLDPPGVERLLARDSYPNPCRTPNRPERNEVRIIIPASDASRMHQKDHMPADGPYWTPRGDEIEELESELVPYLRSHPFSVHEQDLIAAVANRWPAYRRQYVGHTEKGRRLVYLNAFCDSSARFHPCWHDTYVSVADGGPCYFQVSYDPASRQILRVWVNGYA